ncbi:bifunctional DNA primase/polymerase [Glaciibacter psychrotolerans]|uniref:DNA primase n=1 Tax=Glaciibacter psychrotolerans TaxID=670054 RepID=A0A7Z0J549_9MICO|nr:bifunctional DNA primase/polymerase [Leifsonia psychrotolerans]NYJ18529.1 hypothetical protein [Leifsonia psychrotolerans]
MTRGMPARDAALTFARSGIQIFPCEVGGKRPLTHAGFHDASSDFDQVSGWWARWPRANLGMPTGNVSGIDVVDIDVADVDSGLVAFERATAAGVLIDGFARVRTPSGGLHVYYSAIADRPQRCWQAAVAHIDFRGDGGYVVIPPSVLDVGGTRLAYRLVSLSSPGARPVDAVALRQFIDPGRLQVASRRTASALSEPSRLEHWVGNLQEGERNSGLFWAACRLIDAGFAAADIEDTLGPAAVRAGLTEREISTTIRSACRRAGPAAPDSSWGAPERLRSRNGDAPCLS